MKRCMIYCFKLRIQDDGVLEHVEIADLPIGFLPLETDLISLEMNDLYSQVIGDHCFDFFTYFAYGRPSHVIYQLVTCRKRYIGTFISQRSYTRPASEIRHHS